MFDIHQLHPSSRRNSLLLILLLLFTGVAHRTMLLTALWPDLSKVIGAAGWFFQAMQLLPREVLVENPWQGLLYLQMTPPIPNLLYALLVQITDSHARIGTLLMLQGAISTATAILLALLLVRLGARHRIAAVVSLVYLLWGDVVLLEYAAIGFFFHEMLTMLLCCACALAAVNTVHQKSPQAAAWLGVCVALLALTRATFSYFFLVLPLWLMLTGLWRQPRLLLSMAIPVLLLQGGWVLKNYIVHDHFSVTTSTWGRQSAAR